MCTHSSAVFDKVGGSTGHVNAKLAVSERKENENYSRALGDSQHGAGFQPLEPPAVDNRTMFSKKKIVIKSKVGSNAKINSYFVTSFVS